MTHTSTEQQPEALMKLADDYAEACFDQGLHQRTADDKPEAAREKLEKELLRLHARVQELEASQAQRVPLSNEQVKAGCISESCDFSAHIETGFFAGVWYAERAHGITQEKHHGE